MHVSSIGAYHSFKMLSFLLDYYAGSCFTIMTLRDNFTDLIEFHGNPVRMDKDINCKLKYIYSYFVTGEF